jgi:two-component system, OmpR family, phosphate regulon sensor histidine kinase PhoR
LLLLALPLAIAAWAFGGYAANRQRNKVDQSLVSEINAAGKKYQRIVKVNGARARNVANRPGVQRALMRHKAKQLRRFESDHHGIALRVGNKGGLPVAGMAQARVDVNGETKIVGRVIAFTPDRELVSKLGGDSRHFGLLRSDRLLSAGTSIAQSTWPRLEKPTDLVVGGKANRVVALSIGGKALPAALIALRPKAEISAAADRARWRVVIVGLCLIGSLLVLAYALAPAMARSRLSRQQRDQAERVLAHLGDGVFVVDRDGVVRLWNQAAEAIIGVRGTEVRGRPAAEAIPGWATIQTFVPVAEAPGEGDSPSSSETVPVDVDGRELWLSIVAVALDDDTVYAFRDATHDRRLEKLRSEFVATISHELRTPLASLHGAAMTLREHDLPAQTEDDLLEMIAEQSNRLANLVEEILLAGQLDSGSLHVVADTFAPEELARGVVTAARSRLGPETTIDLVAPPVVPNVHGDAERTRQVLLNLVDNAIKYSPSGGQIEVELATVGDRLRFSVHDHGLGIPVGEQERIFDKFYRLDPDHRRGIGGTGLGLYICRELVRSMHGSIWVESEPGEGTTFAFELPAEPLPAPV